MFACEAAVAEGLVVAEDVFPIAMAEALRAVAGKTGSVPPDAQKQPDLLSFQFISVSAFTHRDQ